MKKFIEYYVSIRGLLRALTLSAHIVHNPLGFNPRALTSPDMEKRKTIVPIRVSIRGLLRALTWVVVFNYQDIYVSIRGLLRALTIDQNKKHSEESVSIRGLLRALTGYGGISIRSPSFNPRALTSPDGETPELPWAQFVSIRGLLRALTVCPMIIRIDIWFQSAGSYEP